LGFVVVRDDGERLKLYLVIDPAAPDSLDSQNQPVEPVLSILGVI
jgi:hypothetical protein